MLLLMSYKIAIHFKKLRSLKKKRKNLSVLICSTLKHFEKKNACLFEILETLRYDK